MQLEITTLSRTCYEKSPLTTLVLKSLLGKNQNDMIESNGTLDTSDNNPNGEPKSEKGASGLTTPSTTLCASIEMQMN